MSDFTEFHDVALCNFEGVGTTSAETICFSLVSKEASPPPPTALR